MTMLQSKSLMQHIGLVSRIQHLSSLLITPYECCVNRMLKRPLLQTPGEIKFLSAGSCPTWGLVHQQVPTLLIEVTSSLSAPSWFWIIWWWKPNVVAVEFWKRAFFKFILNHGSFLTMGVRIFIRIHSQMIRPWRIARMGWTSSVFLWLGVIKLFCIEKTASSSPCSSHSMSMTRFMEIWLHLTIKKWNKNSISETHDPREPNHCNSVFKMWTKSFKMCKRRNHIVCKAWFCSWCCANVKPLTNLH